MASLPVLIITCLSVEQSSVPISRPTRVQYFSKFQRKLLQSPRYGEGNLRPGHHLKSMDSLSLFYAPSSAPPPYPPPSTASPFHSKQQLEAQMRCVHLCVSDSSAWHEGLTSWTLPNKPRLLCKAGSGEEE